MSANSSPYRGWGQHPKTKARKKRAKVLNNRTPQEKDVFRSQVLHLVMTKLYNKQFMFWNSELRELSEENALSQGRGGDGLQYAIYWNFKRYAFVTKPFASVDEKAYCMPLNPRIKEYADRMEEIATELDELHDERYEAERFITNLLTFEAPPERFEKVLGATLYRVVQEPVARWFADCADNWSDNSEFGMRTFVEANQEIITKMNERVMLNLVT